MYYKLQPSCIIVRGAKNVIVIDTQRKSYFPTTNSFASLFEAYNIVSQPELDSLQDSHELQMLIEQDIITESKTRTFLEMIAPIDPTYETPSVFTNMLIDVDLQSNHDYDYISQNYLQRFCIRHFEVRIFSKIDISTFDNILNLAKSKWIDTATIRCQYSEDVVEYFNEEIDHSKITDLILYSGSETSILKERNKGFGFIGVLQQPMTSSLHCGYISQEAFVVNGEFIRESLRHNSCLNGKISINSDGIICNCPASNETYGHYKKKENSETLIKNEKFQYNWKINKDLIKKCKECEFRYICIDCRSIREQEDLYSAPLKCGYDPKTGTWEKWEKSEKKAFRYKHLTNK